MRKVSYVALLTFCFLIFPLYAEMSLAEGKARQKGLLQVEEAVGWIAPFSSRTFALTPDFQPIVLDHNLSAIEQFVRRHGYFSIYRPLVGLVTKAESDIEPLRELFQDLVKDADEKWVELATNEIITKALAYRNLQEGMKISLPTLRKGKMILVEYKVDAVLDLWQGMPAFGLIPQKNGISPILLYRGTDFSFTSKNSWASILSDFDLLGAGLTTFRLSEGQIVEWLRKVATPKVKAKVMGFSLGGILAVYTAIFQRQWVDYAIGFNAPGISNTVFDVYTKMNPPPCITLYATQGDCISRFGKMVSSAFEIADQTPLGPIEAHTKIMSALSPIRLLQIDVEKENRSRLRAE
jgi:hypothetical protein